MTEQVVLVGGGGLSREVISTLAEVSDVHVLGVVDDDPAKRGHRLLGVDVLGPLEVITELPSTTGVVVCVGGGAARAALVVRLAALGVADDRYRSVVHPSVTVPASCTIGRGSIILAQVALTAQVQVGSHVVVMPNATLTHDNRIADYATICAGVSLGGAVEVGRAAYLGMNASVRQQLHIGAAAVLGMGSVLLQDLPEGETWVGVPARLLTRSSRPESLLQAKTMTTIPGPELSRRESR